MKNANKFRIQKLSEASNECLKHHLGKRLHFHLNQPQVFQRDPVQLQFSLETLKGHFQLTKLPVNPHHFSRAVHH